VAAAVELVLQNVEEAFEVPNLKKNLILTYFYATENIS
jgi:hypothetical protein